MSNACMTGPEPAPQRGRPAMRLVACRPAHRLWRLWFGRGPTLHFLLRCRLLLQWTQYSHGTDSTPRARLVKTRHFTARPVGPNRHACKIPLPATAHEVEALTHSFGIRASGQWRDGACYSSDDAVVVTDGEGSAFALTPPQFQDLLDALLLLAKRPATQNPNGIQQ